MSAPVEQRHRDIAAITLGNARFELVRDRLNAQEWVAAALADTEAAERERSAALRAEFAACVRALRMVVERLLVDDENESTPVSNDVEAAKIVESALSGPLAKEIPDA